MIGALSTDLIIAIPTGLASRMISLDLSPWQLGVFHTQNVNYTN